MKPRIGINLDVQTGNSHRLVLNSTYYDAVRKADGVPILLAPVNDDDLVQLLNSLSGLVLIGGKDYHPASYGETVSDTIDLADPVRQDFDVRLAKMALARDLPILGICAGHQLLNIVLGGSLVQDIATELPDSSVIHASSDESLSILPDHDITIAPDTKLYKIYGKSTVSTNSSHHQAIKRLGQDLIVTATTEDGVIEAVEMVGKLFTVGVQWHPERDLNNHAGLFQALSQACRVYSHQIEKFDAEQTTCAFTPPSVHKVSYG